MYASRPSVESWIRRASRSDRSVRKAVALALQLCFRAISGLLRRHGSEVTGGGRRDRGCAGAVGRLAARGEAADQAALHPGAGRGLGGAVFWGGPPPPAAAEPGGGGGGGGGGPAPG